ncbi:MAG: hypothetical protein AB1750_05605 [Chloroflexota bacterium]
MTRDNQSTNRDEWLASFTDQVLAGQTDAAPMDSSDSEMRALAETILRLQRAFPKREPDSASIKRIQTGVLDWWRLEERKKARWSKFLRPDWLVQLRRPQFAMALTVIVIVGILIVAAPYLTAGSEWTTGAADLPSSLIPWLLLGIVIAVAFWLARRKS